MKLICDPRSDAVMNKICVKSYSCYIAYMRSADHSILEPDNSKMGPAVSRVRSRGILMIFRA